MTCAEIAMPAGDGVPVTAEIDGGADNAGVFWPYVWVFLL